MFRELIEQRVTGDSLQGSTVVELIDLEVYTFVAVNLGPNSAVVALQITPDKGTYLLDSLFVEIPAHEAATFVPKRFLRYARLVFRSAVPGRPTTLAIVFNGQ